MPHIARKKSDSNFHHNIVQGKNIFRQFIQDVRNVTDVTLKELADILDLSESAIHNYYKKK